MSINLNNILEVGKLLSKNLLLRCEAAYTNIAYDDIQNRRNITVNSNGNGLHNFVPFHFAPRQPILFAIAEGRIPNCHVPQEEMIYLVTTAQHLEKYSFCFTYGHPVMKPVNWYYELENLHNVDWEIFFEKPIILDRITGGYSKFWHDNSSTPDKPKWADRKRRRQAEFLVENHVEISDICMFAVKNEKIKLKVENICKLHHITKPIIIVDEWYK